MNIAVCGYYGMGNFGDELFLLTFRQWLQGHRVFPWSSCIDPSQVDAVVIGGGDLITPYKFNPYYFPEALRHHPTWVYGVGIVDFYPKETWPPEQVALHRDRLGSARSFVLRDRRSAELAVEAQLHPRVTEAPDVVFGYEEPRYPITRSRDKKTIGVCIFAYSSFPREKMTELFLGLLKQGYHLQLLPVVNHAGHAYSDYALCRQLQADLLARMPRANVAVPKLEYEIEMTYSRLQSVDYLLSFKLHPSLAALRGGVPVFCFSQMSKVLHLLKAFGLEDNYCNYEAPLEEIRAKLVHFLAHGHAEVKAAEGRIRLAETEARAGLLRLREELELLG